MDDPLGVKHRNVATDEPSNVLIPILMDDPLGELFL